MNVRKCHQMTLILCRRKGSIFDGIYIYNTLNTYIRHLCICILTELNILSSTPSVDGFGVPTENSKIFL